MIYWKGDGRRYKDIPHYWVVVSNFERAFEGPDKHGDLPLFVVPFNTLKKDTVIGVFDIEVKKELGIPMPLNDTPGVIRCGELQACTNRNEIEVGARVDPIDDEWMKRIEGTLVRVLGLQKYIHARVEFLKKQSK